jgi:hypothetical protein
MSPVFAACLVAVIYILHQDFWFWRTAHPLVLGFLPIGLFYHAAYTVGCTALMAVLVKRAWPGHLEMMPDRTPERTPDLKVGPTSRGAAPDLKVGPTSE